MWTYEFHEQRAELAREEFNSHGLGDFVTVNVRNIVEDGFPVERHKDAADAAFLDLPRPADVVASAAECLKPNGMLCTFSPCIEQVQNACREMIRHGFMDLRPMEVMARKYEVRKERFGGLGLRGEPGEGPPKRQRTVGNGASAPEGSSGAGAGSWAGARAGVAEGGAQEGGETEGRVFVKPMMEARGHTGYLTFARLAPRSAGDGEPKRE